MVNNIGFNNVFYVLIYRLIINSGLLKYIYPNKNTFIDGYVFNDTLSELIMVSDYEKKRIIKLANKNLEGFFHLFSFHQFDYSEFPNWFLNPFNNKIFVGKNSHWTELYDFNKNFGDIKILWELSRFNWLGNLACAYKITHDKKYKIRMDALISDWSKNNPYLSGPNWKCGQEASLRLINLIVSNQIINPKKLPKI